MSDKLMDTVPGGENQNQYEDVHTFIEPHAKQAGQLGGMAFAPLIHLYCATANHLFLQTPQKAPPCTRRPPTPARPTPKASHRQIRSGTDKVSKKVGRAARQQVQRVRRTLKVCQSQITMTFGRRANNKQVDSVVQKR
jgi:hypothetical protein